MNSNIKSVGNQRAMIAYWPRACIESTQSSAHTTSTPSVMIFYNSPWPASRASER